MHVILMLYGFFEVPIRETIKSTGRADICLKLQIIKSVFAILAIVIVMYKGIMAIAYTGVICGGFNIIISAYYGLKILNYKPNELFFDVRKALLSSFVMTVFFCAVYLLRVSPFLTLLIQIFVGIVVYLVMTIILKDTSLKQIFSLVKTIV